MSSPYEPKKLPKPKSPLKGLRSKRSSSYDAGGSALRHWKEMGFRYDDSVYATLPKAKKDMDKMQLVCDFLNKMTECAPHLVNSMVKEGHLASPYFCNFGDVLYREHGDTYEFFLKGSDKDDTQKRPQD